MMWIRALYLLPVKFYQRLISPLLPPSCRYRPTCSAYFVDAVLKRGIFVGTVLGAWRICRCNPWSRGGWDPVDPDEPPPWKETKPATQPIESAAATETDNPFKADDNEKK